jgi:AcrR family transcriptional regulator
MPAGAGDALRTGHGPAVDDGAGAIGSLPATRMRRLEVRARLLEAARALMREADGPGFTVTQVVGAAGTSLKSFYRSFDGKDELLVALFEDDARRGAGALGTLVAGCDDPLGRVRLAVVGLFRFLAEDGRLPYAAALVREHLRLAESHPGQLRGVLEPFVAVFAEVVGDAQARGAVRAGDARRDARTLFHLVVSHLHAVICHQIDEPPTEVADELWTFCAAALRP